MQLWKLIWLRMKPWIDIYQKIFKNCQQIYEKTFNIIREVQVKTMSYNITSISMATAVKEQKTTRVGDKEIWTLVHSWWNTKWHSYCRKQYGSFSNIRNRVTMGSSNVFDGVYPKTESKLSKEYVYTHVLKAWLQ